MAETWFADVLRAAGLVVVEEGDWRSRGTGGHYAPVAVMLHHDASPPGDSPSVVGTLINGRSDLPGPLCQLWVDYHGDWHCIAAGKANHAGSGQWGPIPTDSGNTYSVGIETDHTTAEAWTPEQRASILAGVAALCAHMGIDPRAALCGHKEYAPSRKVDPDPADMDAVRHAVATYNPDALVQEDDDVKLYWFVQHPGDGRIYLVWAMLAKRWLSDPTMLAHAQAQLGTAGVDTTVHTWDPADLDPIPDITA